MGNMSAADMFALTKREPVSNFSENKISKRNNTVAKMVSKAVLAASVMLATQLEAKEEEDEQQLPIDDIQTGSLEVSNAQNSSDAVDPTLERAKSEFASLGSQAPLESAGVETSASSANLLTSQNGLSRDVVTQSLGVSDPAQPIGVIDPLLASFERGQTISQTNGGSNTETTATFEILNGVDGRDGTDGLDGSNGTDGRDGINGVSTVYLDASLFEGTDLLETLRDNGFDVSEGPLGSVAIMFDPEHSQDLIDLLDGLAASENPFNGAPVAENSNEPEHGTTSKTGTEGDDYIFGDDSDNVISGFGGDDHLFGGTGADTLLGGDGVDTADYRNSSNSVHVDLSTSEALFGNAEGDILVSIENLAGSAGDDILTGDNGDNRLTGRDGNDILSGGAGNDRLVGGEGADRFNGGEGDRDATDFNLAQEAVGVDLLNGGFMGEALGDSYSGIEFIVGSDYHDVLLANDDANRINGGEGCDVINGRGGNDTLIGGEGDDVLNGGEGDDVFIFGEDSGYDIIEDFEAGVGRTDRVWLQDHEFDDFEDIQDAMTQTDDGVLLTMDSGTILFQDISLAEFHADDFILA